MYMCIYRNGPKAAIFFHDCLEYLYGFNHNLTLLMDIFLLLIFSNNEFFVMVCLHIISAQLGSLFRRFLAVVQLDQNFNYQIAFCKGCFVFHFVQILRVIISPLMNLSICIFMPFVFSFCILPI